MGQNEQVRGGRRHVRGEKRGRAMFEKASSCKSVSIGVSGSFLWKKCGALSHLGPQECHCSSNGQTRVLREARHDQTSVFIENILVVKWMEHCGVVEGQWEGLLAGP